MCIGACVCAHTCVCVWYKLVFAHAKCPPFPRGSDTQGSLSVNRDVPKTLRHLSFFSAKNMCVKLKNGINSMTKHFSSGTVEGLWKWSSPRPVQRGRRTITTSLAAWSSPQRSQVRSSTVLHIILFLTVAGWRHFHVLHQCSQPRIPSLPLLSQLWSCNGNLLFEGSPITHRPLVTPRHFAPTVQQTVPQQVVLAHGQGQKHKEGISNRK